ncbi:dCMP hydroxymethylase [Aeromonas phage 44RR2.8t]|uniref:dCMP hydroxymethylase n=2 Tax=Biquartavirus 44RR2 TaxID=115987 RepID=Q6U9R8_9CAUD|nr:thymidylate synthase [Aeromonas phage 44RR2.8t]AAQ81353.1 dCMP hydroxymethylase [Aeromonas phage 44RR2.8t]APU00507.1 deoxycytidylate 5-hydroxymethyltransferase [Aeromonas phage 44RR2.8t.2]
MLYMNTQNIRDILAQRFAAGEFVTDKTGVKTIEIAPVMFKADEPLIFGKLNNDYIERELAWYLSQSRYVHDIPGKTPVIWEAVSDSEGRINSNYGWAILSDENGSQFANVLMHLASDPNTRRANMIYTRPTMHEDYKANGMSDFMCTNNVQYQIRDGKLNAVVHMRSNDAIFGYRNDWAWQDYVLKRLVDKLQSREVMVEKGDIYWCVDSIHVYERHFPMIEKYIATGSIE